MARGVKKVPGAPADASGRKDGRRAMLLYLMPDVIKALKMAALERDRPAYEIAEEAIGKCLKLDSKRSKD